MEAVADGLVGDGDDGAVHHHGECSEQGYSCENHLLLPRSVVRVSCIIGRGPVHNLYIRIVK